MSINWSMWETIAVNTNSTYFGQPEIFWTAWEAIGTILAVIIALSIPRQISRWLNKPRLYVDESECFISYELDPSKTISSQAPIHLQWLVENIDLFGIFGKDAINIRTTVWFDSEEKKLWAYQGDAQPLRVLPRNESWIQHIYFKGANPEEGRYSLKLLFSMEGNESKKITIPIEYKRIKNN